MEQPSERTPNSTAYKRRRLQGACDICKHKKIRCDSANMPNNRCSNCIAFNAECTHTSNRKRSGPYSSYSSSKDVMASGLASSSASQVSQALAESPRTIHPLVQPMLSSPSAIDFDTQRSFSVLSQHILKLEQEITNLKQAQNASTASSSREASSSPPASTGVEEHPVTVLNNAASADADVQLSSQLKRMTLSSNHSRHFGPSSTMSLIGVALQVGEEKNRSKIPDDNHTFRRPQFWSVHPWEYIPEEEAPIQDFPHPELMHELVSLFFEHVNPHFPLLHQPTFEKGIKKGLHLTDHNFGSTLLGVCAVASRYTDNPGVLLEGNDSRFAAGWKWYAQIRQCWRSSARAPLLYHIQTICLAILYTHGTSQPEACWVMTGIGIRFCQEVGAHRKRFRDKWVPESELWKRCFWILLCLDALMCSFLGRPRATISYDYDLDLPVECDDEYWEPVDPLLAPQQPPGKPTKLSSFIAFIKLMEILEHAQRTLYSVNRKKCRGPANMTTDEEVVSHLDSELNQWFDGIPEYLKWTSCMPGTIFYSQSALLHASYYHVRILVHRPFIPLPKKPSTLPFPSLAICTNAARSCAHIVKAHSDLGPFLPFPQIQFAVFTSGVLLLVSYWTNLKSSGPPREQNEDLKTVHDCISVLAKLETRWTTFGRMGDIIQEIASYAGVSAPSPSGSNGNEQSDSSRLFGPVNLQFQPQEPFVQGHAQDSLHMPWTSSLPSQPRSWQPSTHAMTENIDLDSDHKDWWNNTRAQTANDAQYGFASGPFTYGNAPGSYMHDVQANSQWPLLSPSGETAMDVGDIAMMWLQPPQLSDWMDVSRY